MNPRKQPNLSVKLAAALLQLRDEDGQPIIPYEHAKLMSAAQINSLFEFDHGILHAIDPIDEPWNLTPRLIAEHREKSRGDKTTVSKVERLEAGHAATQRALQRACGDKRKKTGSIRGRGFQRRDER